MKKIFEILLFIIIFLGIIFQFYVLTRNTENQYKYTNSIKVLTIEGDTAIITTRGQRVDIIVNKNMTTIKLNKNERN